jgi:hypothetical protein
MTWVKLGNDLVNLDTVVRARHTPASVIVVEYEGGGEAPDSPAPVPETLEIVLADGARYKLYGAKAAGLLAMLSVPPDVPAFSAGRS